MKAAVLVIVAAASAVALSGCVAHSASERPANSTRSGAVAASASPTTGASAASTTQAAEITHALAAAAPTAAPSPEAASAICAGNTAAQFILVVISQQHAWMCSSTTLVNDTPVTTGEVDNGDATPTGTWHIQAKQGARYLTTDGASYYVNYWLPFDGEFGFHDAPWQTFPEGSALYTTAGSHGCVHLPEAAMAWLASWADVGAMVTIRS